MRQATKGLNSIVLQDRDLAILRGLFESRIMTAGHIAALFFDGKYPYTKKRLQKLKAAGLIGERRRLVNEPSILFLTRKAFTHLKDRGSLGVYPPLSANSFETRANVSESTLRHELEIMDVKTAFHAALAKSKGFAITEFSTWPSLYEFRVIRPRHGGVETPVRPDGFLRIHEEEEGTKGYFHDFFLEVDRSSKDLDRLVAQARCYVEYYSSGGFAVRNGTSSSEFKEFPFRVLVVLKSVDRRNNLAERLLQCTPPILTQACLSTLKEVIADPLGAIGVRPSEYREATKDTLFDAERRHQIPIYGRQLERDSFVESRIRRIRLLES